MVAYFSSGNRIVLVGVTNGHILGTIGVEVASGATLHATPLLVPIYEGGHNGGVGGEGDSGSADGSGVLDAAVVGWTLYATTSVGGLSAFSVSASEPAELELLWRYFSLHKI